jgi:hypothetical protein
MTFIHWTMPEGGEIVDPSLAHCCQAHLPVMALQVPLQHPVLYEHG